MRERLTKFEGVLTQVVPVRDLTPLHYSFIPANVSLILVEKGRTEVNPILVVDKLSSEVPPTLEVVGKHLRGNVWPGESQQHPAASAYHFK